VPDFAEGKREATPDEFKALANALRLRILRLCLHEPMTNKQLSERLGKDPATVLHHVRLLVRTGFLEAETPRTGASGALEKPYRATGKSWRLSAERAPADQRLASDLAMVDALRDEMADTAPGDERSLARLGLKLNAASYRELEDRLMVVVHEFAGRPDDADGDLYGLFVALHPRA
jgi:DNA-binding transcriptional ArsR family regulator